MNLSFKNKQRLFAFRLSFFISSLSLLFLSCANKDNEPSVLTTESSDPKAIEIADAVIVASGGLENWKSTRYVTWRTFGKRLNVWDRQTGAVRIETRVSCILMNLNTMQGTAWKLGHEITEPFKLKRAIEYGYGAWINDIYWIFLPFKLRDEGVILKYLGEGEKDDKKVDILQLTFDNVGLTPNNKYTLYIDKDSKHIIRWDYYMDSEDDYPRFTTPWGNYKKYGNIILSNDRGEKKHTDLVVFEDLPPSVFTNPDTVYWLAKKPAG